MKYINTEIKDKIGFIILDRPEKRNALNHEVISGLEEAFTQLQEDENVKVIVLKATGKVFCAGADLEYMQQLQSNTYEENLQDSIRLKELYHLIYTLNKVVIAQVHGHAIAGGCGLASVCDFSFAAPSAKFGYTEVKIGFVPALVNVYLIRKIGEGKARELLLSGVLIPAKKAEKLALITQVVAANLEEKVLDFARHLIKNNSEQSMAMTKQMIAEAQNKTLEEGLQYAAEMNASARASTDCKKGIASFLNNEEIDWG